MANGLVDSKFPVGALVPKSETNVLSFLQKYPKYDGRTVTIAILDSGVDPKAAGLEATLDGGVKVIERFDCSGCGDTDVSKKVTVDETGHITGLSGRKLKLTSYMKSKNKDKGEFRIGLKSLFDLYPSKIRERVTADLKWKTWDEPHKKATASVARDIAAQEAQTQDNQNQTLREKLYKEDLDHSMEFLNNYEKKYNDLRTTYDCVVFRSDKCWCAVIDTTEKGDLENAVLIKEYSLTHMIENVDNYLSISINVHDEGNILEIVGMCSSHGTHVASIASGNHKDKDLDGVAPNAKIVSLTIGDGRLGSMETGTSLVRAIIKVMELCNAGTKIDVINMSYGEHAHWSHTGRIGELMNEVVNKYGVVWVASAGNHGPALCTIGTPPDISQPSCIGVGAYISPQMMEAEYALREKLPGNVFTWTSRDPCIDGGQGVTVCAPGAAITSVPEFTMARAQLMNGTSMAAPHVAGAIALLISGLKQKNITYSPYSIKRAIWNTATKLSYVDQFAQGNGLLNVEKAFENLVQFGNQQENSVRFAIKVGNNGAKGIHLRQGVLKKPVEFNVAIEPVFFNENEADSKDKINFNIRVTLVASDSWVECGSFLDLCYVSRNVVIKINPGHLKPGVYSSSIRAYDTANIEKGTLFEIPITVVQPYNLDITKTRIFSPDSKDFKPNTIERSFILVPHNATWGVLKMISISDDKDHHNAKFFIHTMQVIPMKFCKAMETMKILPVAKDNETVHVFKCEGNNILELCIAKYWSNFGDTRLKYSLEFHGIAANGNNTMHGANGIHRIDLTALGTEDISPSIQLKTATMPLKPTEVIISPLSATRDVIPAGRQIYQNLLTYNFRLTKSQEISIHVPLLSTVLYESEYESQFWMLYDSNKMMVACGDAYSGSSFTKQDKGEYVIKLQVRHEKKELLEKVSEMTVLINYKLQNNIGLDIYEYYNQGMMAGKKMAPFQLPATFTKPMYIAPISNEKIVKASLPSQCAWLNGTISYAKDDTARKSDHNPFMYILPECTSNKKPPSSSSPKKGTKTAKDEYKDGVRDYQITMIPKLDYDSAEQTYNEVLAGYPKHLPAHLAFIQLLETLENKINLPFSFKKSIDLGNGDGNKTDHSKLVAHLKKIVDLCTIVINETNEDVLLGYYGLKNDTRPDAADIKTTMDKDKSMLMEAYAKKGIALSKLMMFDGDKPKEIYTISPEQLENINAIYSAIGRFADPTESKVIYFTLWHAFAHVHYGRMAKILQKLYDDKLLKDVLDELVYVVSAKNWEHITSLIQKIAVNANPMGFRPF